MKPFLKWAGGKRWLSGHDLFNGSLNYDRYIEPFLGGGAIFFSLNPKTSVLSDINPELINLYSVIRDYPEELLKLMTSHHRNHSKEYYYVERSRIYSSKIERAARTLYLNRTCFNGLYRVNLKGEFNVPIGTKSSVLMKDDDFLGISKRLQNATLEVSDFEITIDLARDGDLVYVDPPYTVLHNMNGFVKYNDKIFSWEDQIRLRDSVVAAAGRGAHVLLSNADHPSVRDLYSKLGNTIQVPRKSVISGSAGSRKSTTEILVTIR